MNFVTFYTHIGQALKEVHIVLETPSKVNEGMFLHSFAYNNFLSW